MTGGDAAHWDARYLRDGAPTEPAAVVVAQADRLPTSGTALDVAGGAGRHAVWLARRGLHVVLVDASAEALRLAGERASAAGVQVWRRQADLTRDPLPAGPFDLVLVHAFLDRDVLARVPAVLAPGGLLLFAQPTVRNLERHDRPPRRFLLAEGEMATVAADLGLDVLELGEGWTDDDRHVAHLLARRPA